MRNVCKLRTRMENLMRNKSSVHAVTPVARVPRPFVTALRPLQAVLGVFWVVAATAVIRKN